MLTGRHVRRTALPGPAGKPGCSSSHVLVPLLKQPVICVLSWSGEIIHTLGTAELGLNSHMTNWGLAVSPIQEGRLYFLMATIKGNKLTHTR